MVKFFYCIFWVNDRQLLQVIHRGGLLMSLQALTKGEKLPILFVGSGLTRRYKEAPTWEDLLLKIAEYIDAVPAFQKIKSQVMQDPENKTKQRWEINALIASKLEILFNDHFYEKNLETHEEEWIQDNRNPFRECIAFIIKKYDYIDNEKLSYERQLLKNLDEKIIATITTNYDCMLEEVFNYTKDSTFIGQPELFSPRANGLSEIYKLHGCVSQPDKIIISHLDYKRFEETAKLFTAKLMTLMSENPVIFLGYSIEDPNVQSVLRDLVSCLDRSQIDSLNKHFYVIEFDPGKEEIIEKTVSLNAVSYDGHNVTFPVTVLATDNYALIYEEPHKLKPTLNLKLVRQVKRIINDIVLESVESDHLQQNKTPHIAVMLDDLEKIESPEGLAVVVGTAQQVSQYGYGIHDLKFIIEDIIFDKNTFKPKLMVQVTFGKHLCARNRLVPIHKYISQLTVQEVKKHERVVLYAKHRNTAVSFLTNDMRKRIKTIEDITESQLREMLSNYEFEDNPSNIYRYMIKAAISNVGIEVVRDFLQKEFYNYEKMNLTHLADFKRLACIYDFVVYKKHTIK